MNLQETVAKWRKRLAPKPNLTQSDRDMWPWAVTLCPCGRDGGGNRRYYTPKCRKRAQRRRDASMNATASSVTGAGSQPSILWS